MYMYMYNCLFIYKFISFWYHQKMGIGAGGTVD